MLYLQALELLLDFAQALKLCDGSRLERRWLAYQLALAHLLAPLRQHERLNAQRLGNVLDQHAGLIAHLHGLELERDAISVDLLRPRHSHRTLHH
ncbi:MAG: hypothetical protein H0W40_06560 [Methylibium sp.]|uniref:hypothetical protein n=1 Tax=Methylibium sp. TaxID=2067992 RepID=UPI0017F39165|nr:hypothetical protein [Methylibium sp.]MBA3597022.1 hypothetical protein [Methylibium sp.]